MCALENISLETLISTLPFVISVASILLSYYVHLKTRELEKISLTPSVSLAVRGPYQKPEYTNECGYGSYMEYLIINSSNFPAHNVEIEVMYSDRDNIRMHYYPSLASYPHTIKFLELPDKIKCNKLEKIPHEIVIRYESKRLKELYELVYIRKIIDDGPCKKVTFKLKNFRVTKSAIGDV